MGELERPYRRAEYNRALIANAVLAPFNVLLLAGTLIAGLAIGQLVVVLPIAVVLYAIAAARTYLDEETAQRVLERERGTRRRRLEAGRVRVDPETLAEPIRGLALAALDRQERIREAIERAELDYDEVSQEVDGFVRAIHGTAARAQLLHEALADNPPNGVEDRLRGLEAEGDPGRRELVDALRHQLGVQRRMEQQLRHFHDEMERLIVELDTVRGSLISVSASTEAANQERLAAEVRGLREELGTLADGMAVAYEQVEPPPKAE